jgi:hypothetical protein
VVEIPPLAPPKIWSGRLQLGLNGAEGNSQQFMSRFTAKGKRETPDNKLTLDFLHILNHVDSELTQNNWLLDGRSEWPCWSSCWSVFVHNTTEFDDFKAFDYRVTADAGLLYKLIKNETTEFQLRAGAGFSHEYGVAEADYVPEASYGLTFDHQVAKRSKLLIKGDMYPDWRDWGDYRAQGEGAWEIKVNEDGNVSVRLSVIDRYDATPFDKKHNDLTYAAEAAWDF